MEDPGPPGVDGGAVTARLQARSGRLHADQADAGVVDELAEHADGVGAPAHAGDHLVRQSPRQGQHLGAGLAGDAAVVLVDDGGEGVGAGRRAQQVVGGGEGRRPVAQRLVDGVLEGARPAGHGHHARAHELHALDVGRLAHHVGGAHVDGALQAQQGADHGGGGAVLARSGLGDDAGLAHAPGQQRLTQDLVALVGPAVDEVLALEEDAGPALQRQGPQLGDRGGPAQEAAHEVVELGGEGRVGPGLDEGVLQLVEGRDEQLGHVLPAVGAEVGGQPGVRVAPAGRAGRGRRTGVVGIGGLRRIAAGVGAVRADGGGQGLGEGARVGGARQGRADEQGVDQPGQAAHVVGALHARLPDEHGARRRQRRQLLRAGDIGGQGPQVPVVDADDARAQPRRPVHLLGRADLREDLHAQVRGQVGELAVDVVGHHGEHEQDRVRPQRAGGQHLNGVDDEVLAQHRRVHRRAHGRQVLEGAVEAVGLGEHGDGRRPGGVGAGEPGRVVVGADGAARGGGRLALHDEGRARGGALAGAGAQGVGEGAGRAGRGRLEQVAESLAQLGDARRARLDDGVQDGAGGHEALVDRPALGAVGATGELGAAGLPGAAGGVRGGRAHRAPSPAPAALAAAAGLAAPAPVMASRCSATAPLANWSRAMRVPSARLSAGPAR